MSKDCKICAIIHGDHPFDQPPERIEQCALCAGEPGYGINIPVNLLDGGVEEQWRQVCDSCSATILRAVASNLR